MTDMRKMKVTHRPSNGSLAPDVVKDLVVSMEPINIV